LKGTETILSETLEEIKSHNLSKRIAKTTGNAVMITGAILGIFTFGASAIVAGAIGGAIAVGTDIADWIISGDFKEKIARATQDMTEFQEAFRQHVEQFNGFVDISVKRLDTDVPYFMALMKGLKRAGQNGHKLYTVCQGIDNTRKIIQFIRQGKSLAWAARGVINAADLSACVARVGMNLGKDVGTFTKYSTIIGEKTSGVCKFLSKIAPLLNVVDIIVTWTTTSPVQKECEDQLNIVRDNYPKVRDFIDGINPGEIAHSRALEDVKFAEKHADDLYRILTATNTIPKHQSLRRMAVFEDDL